VVPDEITYDIFKDDPVGGPLWIEAVAGLEHAMSRMEGLASAEDCDYYLFCSQEGRIVGRSKRKLPRSGEEPNDKSWKMAG
jgi:hypothetical protein